MTVWTLLEYDDVVLKSSSLSCGDAHGIVCAKTTASPRQQKVDAFVTQEMFSLEQAEDAMSEELLCHPLVEIGNRHPLAGGIPPAPGAHGVNANLIPWTALGKVVCYLRSMQFFLPWAAES